MTTSQGNREAFWRDLGFVGFSHGITQKGLRPSTAVNVDLNGRSGVPPTSWTRSNLGIQAFPWGLVGSGKTNAVPGS